MLFRQASISRRELLARGASAVAGLAAASAMNVPGLAAGVPGGKPAKKMRFGLTAYQLGEHWDLPTMIANCTKTRTFGVELRTSEKYAHGVELEIGAARRREVRKMFADSPVTLVGLASSEKFDWPDAERVKKAIEDTKLYLNLSRDVGGSGVRVFVNDFQRNIPHEQTQAQVAKALNVVVRRRGRLRPAGPFGMSRLGRRPAEHPRDHAASDAAQRPRETQQRAAQRLG